VLPVDVEIENHPWHILELPDGGDPTQEDSTRTTIRVSFPRAGNNL
jgi:hypothetical protein